MPSILTSFSFDLYFLPQFSTYHWCLKAPLRHHHWSTWTSKQVLLHKVKTQYVYFRLHTNYFLLPWKILKKLADDQCSSVTNMSMQPFTMRVDWPEIWSLMEIIYHVWYFTYCVFTLYGRVVQLHDKKINFMMKQKFVGFLFLFFWVFFRLSVYKIDCDPSKVPGSISQNEDFNSNDASSPTKSWFKFQLNRLNCLDARRDYIFLQLPVPYYCVSLLWLP